MKFYESHFDEYVQSVQAFNFHEELVSTYSRFPENVVDFENLIIYGPCGSGKYSQMLFILHSYGFKYEKKITADIEKQTYRYKISDIHYEIDMSLLGCNSKNLWHDIFQNIIDIISVKSNRHGIIVCTNFHTIHNELLEIFYSYMQQYNNHSQQKKIQVKFILITDQLSFIPDNITHSCYLLKVKKPLTETIEKYKREFLSLPLSQSASASASASLPLPPSSPYSTLSNLKEMYVHKPIINHFNVICDTIVRQIMHMKLSVSVVHSTDFVQFRDQLYDILIYNLDVSDCVWYIFTYFIVNNLFCSKKMDELLEKINIFFVQHGNNYRAIFHIENLFFSFIRALL
jgi:hypothetical protein